MKPTTEGRFIGLGISRFSTGLSVGPAHFIRTALFMKEANINKGRHESSCRYLANYFEQLSCSKRRRRWPKREGGRGIPEAVAVTLATGAHLIKAPDPLE